MVIDIGRPHKNNSEELIALLEDFFTNEIHGNPDKLKCSLLAAYAAKKGFDIKAHNLRRDQSVRARMEELRTLAVENGNVTGISYKTLDVDSFLRQNCSLNTLKKALTELDEYWKSVYETASRLQTENARLCAERSKRQQVLKDLQSQEQNLKEELQQSQKAIKDLKEENQYIKKLLNTYVYPEVASELLRRMNLPAKERGPIDDEALNLLIAPKRPEAYAGPQNAEDTAQNRGGKLIQLMRKQVED